MITIDGSRGEGGGQILRTTVALSALTGRPVRVTNIRAKRPNPGLRAQHITAVKTVAELTSATVKGLSIGSPEVEFYPADIRGVSFRVDIGTAGSVTLVFQALMIASTKAQSKVEVDITGGTDVNWSPPIDYLQFVTLPILKKHGYTAEIKLVRRGFYPKGGGRARVEISPAPLQKIELVDAGEMVGIQGISFAHRKLGDSRVAERQREAALRIIKGKFGKIETKIEEEYVDSLSLGSGIVLWAENENSRLGADSLGERGKRAESVGEEAARDLIEEIDSGACLDRYMADQIVPYLALAGGRASISQITRHTTTHIEVVKTFGFKVELKDKMLEAT